MYRCHCETSGHAAATKEVPPLQIYLAVTPQDCLKASVCGQSLAHVAYRIGRGSSLLRSGEGRRRGLLSLSDRNAPPVQRPEALTAALLREIRRRSSPGILLDFEGEAVRDDLAKLAACLVRALPTNRQPVYVPEPYAAAVPGTVPLLCTAISGGVFSRDLREQLSRWHGRAALDVQRLRMDFTLPAADGIGTPMDSRCFQTYAQRATVFFSTDLCAKYFTYCQNSTLHLVLFDDADSLVRKLRIGASLGFSAAFLMWPEIQDTAVPLFRQLSGQ